MQDRSWASSAATRRSMQANRSRDTKPELELRRLLHAMGLRYRVCARPLPGIRHQADIVFRPARVAVEVRGCFWHQCPQHYRAPANNNDYWAAKAARNVARDDDAARRLAGADWELFVVWEHQDRHAAAAEIARLVTSRRAEISAAGRRSHKPRTRESADSNVA